MLATTRHRLPSTMLKRTLGHALMIAALAGIATTASADAMTPFQAHFNVSRGVLGLGTATFHLRPAEKPGCYVYTGHANPNALAHLFIGKITEKSRFCITNGHIHPSYFKHHIAGDKKHSYTLHFDWSRHVVHYENGKGKNKTLRIGKQALDPLSLQIAARRWIEASSHPTQLGQRTFTLVDGDDIKPYKLKVETAPDVSVPAGHYSVLLVQRVNDNHPLKFWLAKNADWIPVRVEKTSGGNSFEMNMRKLVLNGHIKH